MYGPERQDAIAVLVRQRGRVSVNEIATSFGVTQETVRRDLDQLEQVGLLRRVHGGAVPLASVVHLERVLAERNRAHSGQKERIARAARRYLPADGGSVVLDAGSTTSRLAAQLPVDRRLDVITNSVTIASILTGTKVALQLVGGRVRPETHAAVGEDAVAALGRLRVDVAFIGTNGLTVQHGASTHDSAEAAVKRAMVSAARRVVVLADSTKMGREHLVQFADPGEIDVVVTDDSVDQEFSRGLLAADIEVVVA